MAMTNPWGETCIDWLTVERVTPPKFNMEPEKDAFQRESPFGMAFQGQTVSFRGGIKKKICDNAMILGHFFESAFAEKKHRGVFGLRSHTRRIRGTGYILVYIDPIRINHSCR